MGVCACQCENDSLERDCGKKKRSFRKKTRKKIASFVPCKLCLLVSACVCVCLCECVCVLSLTHIENTCTMVEQAAPKENGQPPRDHSTWLCDGAILIAKIQEERMTQNLCFVSAQGHWWQWHSIVGSRYGRRNKHNHIVFDRSSKKSQLSPYAWKIRCTFS